MADPAATLRSMTGHLRPGGIVAFQDIDMMHEPLDVPPSPLNKLQWDWTGRVFARVGIDLVMGLKLHHVFLDAGLPMPQMQLSAPVGGGPDWAGYEFLATMFRTTLQTAQTLGLATPDEVTAIDVDTFATRLRDEVVQQGGVITLSPYAGAWTCKP
jgi:hypothetical protein